MRAPLLLAIAAFFVLSRPAQVLELYLILARNPVQLWTQVSLAILSLTVLAFFLTFAGRSLARAADEVRIAAGEKSPQATVFRVLPIMIGVLPLLGAALGLWRALKSTLTDVALSAVATLKGLKSEDMLVRAAEHMGARELNFKQINDRVDLTVSPAIRALPESAEALASTVYAGMAICASLALVLVLVYARTPRSEYFEPTDRAFHPAVTYTVGAVFLVLVVLITAQYLNAGAQADFDFTQIPRTLGTLSLVNISLISLVYVSSLLTRWSDKHGIPLIAPLLVLAALISIQNWNDNHHVRLVSSPPEELAARKLGESGKSVPVVIQAFDAWMKARPADYVRKFDGRPYPIYVVAAQGGGMYAANLSGLTLARLYDRCPALRHHVFAVSGVSGGSIGAGYFAALLGEAADRLTRDTCTVDTPAGGVGPLETQMEKLLQADLLAPVAASFLFPDLLQRLIPYPIEAFDRARAFEAGVEQAWAAIFPSARNPLREAFWRHWKPDGAAPMLFLNATVADTGQQVPIAPINLNTVPNYFIRDLKTLRERAGLPDDQDVPLSTAMSLSARFPLVMPAGLVRSSTKTLRLVDGGYFENSGVETAQEVIIRISGPVCGAQGDFSNCVEGRGPAEKRAYAFRTIVLTDYDDLREAYELNRNPQEDEAGLNELLSPLRAMVNVRTARGELIVGKLQVFNPAGRPGPAYIPAAMVTLNHRIYGLPLGWQLSKEVQAIISAQIGEPDQCVRGGSEDFLSTLFDIGGLDVAFEQMAAKREKRAPRPVNIAFGTPFMVLLKRLQDNHCSVFNMLQADGVLPPSAARL